VITPANDQGARNLACCFLRLREFAAARNIAESLATRNPDDIKQQIFAAQVLAAIPGAAIDATAMIARTRANYKLDTDQKQFLVSLEEHIGRE
jgi:hypothetical protein